MQWKRNRKRISYYTSLRSTVLFCRLLWVAKQKIPFFDQFSTLIRMFSPAPSSSSLPARPPSPPSRTLTRTPLALPQPERQTPLRRTKEGARVHGGGRGDRRRTSQRLWFWRIFENNIWIYWFAACRLHVYVPLNKSYCLVVFAQYRYCLCRE